jgi:MtrB/PioB family decaheme-associated outer membrane protein
LLSSSAKTIFSGVGTNRLTVDSASRTFLQSQMGLTGPSPNVQTQAQRTNIDDFINGRNAFGGAGFAAPMSNIELKTLREKFTASYRNTMVDSWEFNVDYSNEHRTGTRPLGIGYGYAMLASGNTTSAPRPSSGSVEVPQPLDDRTQNVNGAGEYSGTTPWGTRWNTSVKYAGSFYGNSVKSIDVDNPFCITCVPYNGVAIPGGAGTQVGPNLLRYGLYPDNNANGVTWNNAVDLPFLKSRYTSNVQYTMYRQNDPFLNDATNGITTLAAYPAASLNGAVNAFLTNNVLYSHLTKDLTNTARVRYYDRQDNTPVLAFTNYAYGDGGTATTQPLTREPHSYSRLNIEDDLKWQASRAWTFGAGYFFERYAFQNGEVGATNESGAKAFVNWKPYSWLIARSSLQYSQRRYDTWLASGSDAAARAMRFFFVQNRDRTKSSTIVELQLTKNITVSPNGGLRWDNYPTDRVLNTLLQQANSLGTQYDRSWNLGSDLSVRVTPDLRLNFGYNHEEHYLMMQSCCGGATGAYTEANKWSSTITQKYNTFMAAAEWKAIPGKLDFKADYVAAISNEANDTTKCTSGASGCTGNNSAGVTNPFPDEHNIFQRFNLTARYFVDPGVVRQMGWNGEVVAKLRYIWEQNRNTNWATDNFSPYSPSSADAGGVDISNGGRSLFLAYNNPNYTAQMIVAALAVRW